MTQKQIKKAIQALRTALSWAVALLLFFLPVVQKKALGLALRLVGRELSGFHFSTATAAAMVAGYGAGWVFPGVSLYCLALSINPGLDPANALPIIILNTIAGISGVISLFAPCGIGVRDGVLLFGLSAMMPGAQAADQDVLDELLGILGVATGVLDERLGHKRGWSRESTSEDLPPLRPL